MPTHEKEEHIVGAYGFKPTGGHPGLEPQYGGCSFAFSMTVEINIYIYTNQFRLFDNLDQV